MKKIDGVFREHCIECGQLIEKRVIDYMDEADDPPRNRRATPRFSDLTRLSNKVYNIYNPEKEQ